MALPGKLCIGIIEEDNPQKSYFRFKPLLVAEDDGYVNYDGTADYPENGCIRIVPDKNESSRFKARMRRMGRYCMVDLRDHPDDNDKIRPNKNFHGDDIETNAYIIYSDVVRELPVGVLAEVIEQDIPGDSAQIALALPQPHSERVVFSGFEPFGTLWLHAPIVNTEDGVAFTRTDCVVSESAYRRCELPGFGGQVHTVLVAKPGEKLFSVETTMPAATAAPAAPTAPAVPAAPAAVAVPDTAEPAAEQPAPAPEAPATQPAAPVPEPRPWLHHDESIIPPPVDPRLSPREQAIALQTGINPRRGRSLHEIIEDKWRRSRFDQLGHPVPGDVTGQPVSTPVDNAYDAVRAAWAYVNARSGLAQALAKIEGLSAAIHISEDSAAAEARAAQLNEYAQAREELAAEIERCRAERDGVQEEMLRDIQRKHAEEIAAHTARIETLTAEEAALRSRADEAQNVAREAEQAVARLTDEALTARLSEFAVGSRAASLLAELSKGKVNVSLPVSSEPVSCASIPLLVRRVRAHFNANGYTVSDDEALNLLACFVLGDKLLITGPAGSGKTTAAKLLAEALGMTNIGRCAKYAPSKDASYEMPFAGENSEYPAVIIADDINTRGNDNRIVDDIDEGSGVKLIMTAQDSVSGEPIGLRLLDRCFTIRLKDECENSHWGGPAKRSPAPEGCITAASLTKLFTPDAKHISAQVTARLSALRKELAGFDCRISRRTLDAIWLYCATVTPYMSLTPLEVFDLAFAQRALPSIISSAGTEALHALPNILKGMTRSLELLDQPLAIEM